MGHAPQSSCPLVTCTPVLLSSGHLYSSPSKMNVNDVKMPEGEEEKLKKSLSILKEVFSSKATDGKLTLDQVMPTYFEVLDKYLEEGIYGAEEVEQIKKMFDGEVKGAMKKFDENQDGLIDWDEFMAIMAESEANWVQSLFKEFDANQDGTITGEEMKAMTEKMIAEGNAAKAKIMKEMFDFVLLNFDCDGDGNISVEEFTTAMKSMQF